jgi:4-hydroxy-2-oxoheptanedioate aldolase
MAHALNPFKAALARQRPLLGLWQALANPYTAEICAGCGFDWLLFDGEHAPNTLQTLLGQLQAVGAYPVAPVVRPPAAEAALIKQYLDIGATTLLMPMIDNAQQAERVVAATRFPPRGVRGVASSTSRASGFGAQARYLQDAHETMCVLVQIESGEALEHVEAIAAVEGVDGLFIGPGDLAASLGYLGEPRHPRVQAAIADALARIARAGKPAGTFALDLPDARARLAQGVRFVSVGTDIGLLACGGRGVLDACRVEP